MGRVAKAVATPAITINAELACLSTRPDSGDSPESRATSMELAGNPRGTTSSLDLVTLWQRRAPSALTSSKYGARPRAGPQQSRRAIEVLKMGSGQCMLINKEVCQVLK